MRAFRVVELANNQFNTVCYSASATGAGNDELMDFNKDGQYDGYTQDRWSYDVLYYPLFQTYKFQNGEFILKSTSVSIPDYPTDIKDVVLQYLTLKVLNVEGSPEADKRLSELCKNKDVKIEFPISVWHPAVYHTTLGIGNMIIFDIKEESNSAYAEISYNDEDNKGYKQNFYLKNVDSRWVIDGIK